MCNFFSYSFEYYIKIIPNIYLAKALVVSLFELKEKRKIRINIRNKEL